MWYVCYIADGPYSLIISFPKARSLTTCIQRAMLKQADNPHLTYVVVNGITKERVPVRRWSDKEIRSNG